MLIDCDVCEVRGPACSDCVVSVLLGVPDGGAELDRAEQVAIGTLADAGLVPPLRLVVNDPPADDGPPAAGGPGGRHEAAATPDSRSAKDPEDRGAGHLPRVRSAG